MKKRIVIVSLLVIGLALSVASIGAYADGHGKDEISLEDKFYCKAMVMLKNEEELGLSEKQVETIKKLKIDTKKDLIRKNAEIDVLALDIKMEMYKDSMDTAAVNKLVDKKYDIKKEKTKAIIAACAELKDTLTKDQKSKLKDIIKQCKKDMAKDGKMIGGKNCPMMGKMKR